MRFKEGGGRRERKNRRRGGGTITNTAADIREVRPSCWGSKSTEMLRNQICALNKKAQVQSSGQKEWSESGWSISLVWCIVNDLREITDIFQALVPSSVRWVIIATCNLSESEHTNIMRTCRDK